MKKFTVLFLVMFTFFVYLKNGEVIKAEKIFTGEYGAIVRVLTTKENSYIPEERIYPLEQIDHIVEK